MPRNLWKAAAVFAIVASPVLAEDQEPSKPPKPVAAQGYERALRVLHSEGYPDRARAVEQVHLWSLRLFEAEARGDGPGARKSAAALHLARMNDLVAWANHSVGSDTDANALVVLDTQYYRDEAFRLLKNAEDAPKIAAVETPAPAPAKDAQTLAVLKALEARVAMPFKQETPLDDVLKYVRENTRSSEFPDGVPIYVDPDGLDECEKTIASPVSIELEGVPLRQSLPLALRQLGLVLAVDDGLLLIGSQPEGGAALSPPVVVRRTPLQVLKQRAERGELDPSGRQGLIETLKDLREIERLSEPENGQGVMGGLTGVGP